MAKSAEEFSEKSPENGLLAEKGHDRKSDRTWRKNKREATVKWNQMTALGSHTDTAETSDIPGPPSGPPTKTLLPLSAPKHAVFATSELRQMEK